MSPHAEILKKNPEKCKLTTYELVIQLQKEKQKKKWIIKFTWDGLAWTECNKSNP